MMALMGVFLMLVLMLSFTIGSSSSNPYLHNYQPYEVSADVVVNTPWEKEILFLYNQGEYSYVMPMLEQIVVNPSVKPMYRFMLGVTYLELSDLRRATYQFEKLSKSRNRLIRQEGLWYLSIAQFKNGNTAEAIQSLELLTAQEGAYHERATQFYDHLSATY